MHPVDYWPFWPRLGIGAAASSIVWLAAWLAGDFIVERTKLARAAGVDGSTRPALGFVAIGSIIASLALLRLCGQFEALCLPLVVIAARLHRCVAVASGTPGCARRVLESWRTLAIGDRLAVAACAIAGLTATIAAALPAVFWDPIAYHLPIAAAALRTGTLGFDPAMSQSGFPLLAEAAALPAYAIAGSAGAAFTMLGCGWVLALACKSLADRFAPGTGILAACLVVTCPLWIWLAPTFYVDIPFAMLAVVALALASAGALAAAPQPFAFGAVCGVLAGAAAAVKYPGLAICAIACTQVLAGADRGKRLAGFVAGAIAVAAGWYIRSFVLTGDPVYPFGIAIVGNPNTMLAGFATRYVDMTKNWCGGGASIADAFLLPWRMLTDNGAARYCGDPGYALKVSIVLYVAALTQIRRLWPVIVAGLALTVVWFLGARQDRFIVAAACMYAVAAAAGSSQLREGLRSTVTGAIGLIGAASVLLNWVPSMAALASNSVAPGFAYVAGAQTADEYLLRRLEFEGAARWIGAHAPLQAKIGAVDDVRDYYMPRSTVWLNPFYQPVWQIDWNAPGATRYAAMARAGITYLVVNANKAYVNRTPTGVNWAVLAQDVRAGYLRSEYSSDNVTVYTIRSQAVLTSLPRHGVLQKLFVQQSRHVPPVRRAARPRAR